MSDDLASIGLAFPRWQDAVEAAIGTDRLAVTGAVRGGQLIQYADPSGATINILAVEPYATWAGFNGLTQTQGSVDMVSDVLALIEVSDLTGESTCTLTANLAQGPLFAEVGPQPVQPLSITALGLDIAVYDSPEAYEAATGEVFGVLLSEGAALVSSGSGAAAPDAAAQFSARVLTAEHATSELTGQHFVHATVDGPLPFDLCLPAGSPVPAAGQVVAGTALMTASVLAQGGCGSSGGCGCGGCGGH
ncbi:hypothetical protein CATYP_04360 [Corynebacterium atypicum]|uniref:Uncharacterized protein n=1 Tax=Corynebacterium atypicum TaxID=191610 RepID=A0ABM5QMK4_9CORY|nr:hypothetical protein [Corynebacterium atypicum]AIG64009.1 hypothetical protein CATYP_04360 [Corynebacterium atypicum]